MKAPKRMMDDRSQSRRLRRDLERTALAPVDYDLNAGLLRMRASMNPTPSSPPPTLRAPRAWTPLKWAMAIATGGATMTAIAFGIFLRAEANVAHLEVADSSRIPIFVSPPPSAILPAPRALATTQEIATPAFSVRATHDSSSPIAVVKTPTPSTSPSSSKAHANDSLRDEIDQLETLRSLASENPAQAVVVADEGQRRFRDGIFEQEREAIAIRSLARVGRTDEAKTRARMFLDRFPKSPFAEKIRQEVAL